MPLGAVCVGERGDNSFKKADRWVHNRVQPNYESATQH